MECFTANFLQFCSAIVEICLLGGGLSTSLSKPSMGPFLDIRGMDAFFGGNVFKKGAFRLLAPPNQMPFLTISNENIFFENQGTRLEAIIAPNKGLEQALKHFRDFLEIS